MKFPTYQPYTKYLDLVIACYATAMLVVAAFVGIKGAFSNVPSSVWTSSAIFVSAAIVIRLALTYVSTVALDSEGLTIHTFYRLSWAGIKSATISRTRKNVRVDVTQDDRPRHLCFLLELETFPTFVEKLVELCPRESKVPQYFTDPSEDKDLPGG